jgi:hypothetical protein
MAKHAKKVTIGGFRLKSMRLIEESPEQLRDRREVRERLRERMAINFATFAFVLFLAAIVLGTEGAPWDDVAAAAAAALTCTLISFGLTKTGAAKARRVYEAYRGSPTNREQ